EVREDGVDRERADHRQRGEGQGEAGSGAGLPRLRYMRGGEGGGHRRKPKLVTPPAPPSSALLEATYRPCAGWPASSAAMKHSTLPRTDITAPSVVLGLMRIAQKSDAEIRALVGAARDAGIDFLDHADIYGEHLHQCEERFAQAMALTPSQRDQVTIQTKAGIVKDGPYFDYSYEHLTSSVEGSLRALNTDRIDILLLHRPDALVEPEEVARAFDELHTSGKVRHFGVSNHTPRQIDLLAK